MLRAVRLNNIGDFCEDHILSFRQDGVYFFVGQNGSGESKMFEAIKICLFPYLISEKSFPQVVDKCKPAYIICKCEMPDRSQNHCHNSKEIFTSFVYIPDAESKTHQYAHIVSNDNKYILYISLFNNIKECGVFVPGEKEGKLEMEICKHLQLCVNDNPESTDLLLKALKELLEKKNFLIIDCGPTKEVLENSLYLLYYLKDDIYFPTPITEYGWKENYKILEDKCKYITSILSPKLCDTYEKPYDSQEENKIFRIMTGNANYSFQVKKDEDELSGSIDGKTVDVSKLPEDILVAKYVSLLLTSNKSTVFLEEPERGMSSHMIQRFRDIVLPQLKHKTIVIVSHKSVLMTSLSIPRTYKVYKEKQGVAWKCKMVSLSGVAEICKNPRLLDTDEFDILIFEKNVIFVESQSDFIFVNALKAHILTSSNDKSVMRVIKLFLSDPGDIDYKLNKFHTFLQSLHVVKMSSYKNKNEQYWHTVSKKVGLSKGFLLNRDVVVDADRVETCILAVERVKSYIERIVTEALINKQGNSQETRHMKSALHQPLEELPETEEEKQRKSKDQDNSDLKCIVSEAMTCKFWDQSDNVSEEKTVVSEEGGELQTAEERLKKVIVNTVSRKECNDVKALLKSDDIWTEDDKKTYFQYYDLKYKELLNKTTDKNCDTIPISTKYKPKELHVIDSPNPKSEFKNQVESDNWEAAANCLEEEGVFVWRSGNIEDAFIDLVINFDCDAVTKDAKMYRKYTSFAELGLTLNLAKLYTREQSNLCLFDKVSNDEISEIIVTALTFCNQKSDITQFIRFLMNEMQK